MKITESGQVIVSKNDDPIKVHKFYQSKLQEIDDINGLQIDYERKVAADEYHKEVCKVFANKGMTLTLREYMEASIEAFKNVYLNGQKI
jgi:hypothetical protein